MSRMKNLGIFMEDQGYLSLAELFERNKFSHPDMEDKTPLCEACYDTGLDSWGRLCTCLAEEE